jgi:hypothetical protein
MSLAGGQGVIYLNNLKTNYKYLRAILNLPITKCTLYSKFTLLHKNSIINNIQGENKMYPPADGPRGAPLKRRTTRRFQQRRPPGHQEGHQGADPGKRRTKGQSHLGDKGQHKRQFGIIKPNTSRPEET